MPKLPSLKNLRERIRLRERLRFPNLRDPNTRLRLLLYGGAAFLVLLFFTAIIFPLSSNPVFCGKVCHSQLANYETWQKSSHAKITCYACHVEPGLDRILLDKMIAGPKGIFSEITGLYEKPINAHSKLAKKIPTENCERCHSPENRDFTPSQGIKIDHEIHLKKNINCTTCHNRITHSGKKGYQNFLTMRGCFRCHGQEKTARAPGKCTLCHTPDFEFKPPSHRTPEWAPSLLTTKVKVINARPQAEVTADSQRKNPVSDSAVSRAQVAAAVKFQFERPYPKGGYKHGRYAQEDIKNCLMCHEKRSFCDRCHGTLRKEYQHAKQAKADPGSCRMCHEKRKFCDKCHQTTMPHQRPWSDRHGATVVKKASFTGGDKVKLFCNRCHIIEKFCTKCHKGILFPHPTPWAPLHGKEAKKTNKLACRTCHRAQFCRKCHGSVEMPHPSNWLGEHRKYFLNRPVEDCLKCHQKNQCEQCHSVHSVHNIFRLFDLSRPPQLKGE